jgi:hypothetical protein
MHEPEDFDDSNEIQLTVVRGPSTPPYEKGVRTRLTARTFLRIIKRIETGWPVTQSCKAEGLTYRRFRQLCQRWPAYQRRYERAERQRAEHRRETMEALVLHAAAKNWVAAAWWLERSHPGRYSLKTVIRDESTGEEKPLYQALTREELLECIRATERIELERPKGCQPVLSEEAS